MVGSPSALQAQKSRRNKRAKRSGRAAAMRVCRAAVESMEERVLLSFAAHINFEPAGGPSFAGYTVDAGRTFASRNGLTYGWNAPVATFSHNSKLAADARYSTGAQMQKGGNSSAKWEIAVPNGVYTVHVVTGDPTVTSATYSINAEGVPVVSGSATSQNRWVSGTASVSVTDGRLTISNGSGAKNNAIDFVDITADAPPTVSIAAPTASAAFPVNQAISLSASAADSDGAVKSVQFFDNGSLLGFGALTGGLYTYTWAGAAVGTHSITAVATDNGGVTTTSSAVAVQVNPASNLTTQPNVPPSVSVIGPISGQVVMPTPAMLMASASDSDGTVSSVQFAVDNTIIGTATANNGLYTLMWPSPTSGNHSITAIATDNSGAQTTSTAVPIRVDALPSVTVTSPAAGSVTLPGTPITLSASASDIDGTVQSVRFFGDGVALGFGTLSNGVYSFTWANAAAGTHKITAVASDNDNGSAQSAVVQMRVDRLPSISVTAPANGAMFQPGVTIPLSATASDSDGTIAGVQFFADGSAIGAGVLSNGIYTFNWSGATGGAHQITAVATDSDGGQTTSSAISVRVNSLPSVSVTSPTSGAVVLPASVALSATASDSDGTVSAVQFFSDGTAVGAGALSNGVYSFNWTNAPSGNHQITAVATDNNGGQTSSTAISIHVDALPTATITSPSAGAVVQAGGTFSLSATAGDSDGTIAGVEFFADGADLGSGTLSNGVYSFSWSSAAIGAHQITAVATDNDGGKGTSPAVPVRVNNPPSISITTPAVVQQGPVTLSATASDTDGTIAHVEFFADGQDLGAGTLSGGSYTFTWNGASPGTHSISAVATDNDGAQTTALSANARVNQPPSVGVTSPTAGSIFTGGTTITLTASASDADGTVASVQFFADGTSIGTGSLSNGSYSFNWNGAPSGPHQITAVATDNNGGQTTSSSVPMTVHSLAVLTVVSNQTITAGHPVQVQAINSGIGVGTPISTQFIWNFGDTNAGSEFNSIEGFNAAHEYDTPGTYPITLTMTDASGYISTAQTSVTVLPADSMRTIYVSTVTGSDTNDGSSPATPIRTVTRAAAMLGSNTKLLFEDGDTFNLENQILINGLTNVIIGSYGQGPAPVLLWDGPRNGGNMIAMQGAVRDVTIRGLAFDSIYTADTNDAGMPVSIHPVGNNIAVIGDEFLNVNYGVNGELNPTGVLVQDCSAPLVTGLRGYLVWVQGADYTIIGNSASNSTRQHIVRVGGDVGLNVSFNNFTNLDRTQSGDSQDIGKGTIVVQKGSYAYVGHNTVTGGPIGVGPLQQDTDPAAAWVWAVVDSNTFNQTPFHFIPGSSHTLLSNNIIHMDNGPSVIVEAPAVGRIVADGEIVNNTATDTAQTGNFLFMVGTATGTVLADNLYVAPNLVTGQNQTAPVYVGSGDLSSFSRISHNVWPVTHPNSFANGGVNYVWPFWSDPRGYMTPVQWDSSVGVDSDKFSDVQLDANNAPIAPSAAIAGGVSFAGVFTDFYGNARVSTDWTVGAVNSG